MWLLHIPFNFLLWRVLNIHKSNIVSVPPTNLSLVLNSNNSCMTSLVLFILLSSTPSLSQIIVKQIPGAYIFIYEYFSVYVKDKDFLKDNYSTIIVVITKLLKKEQFFNIIK